MQARPLTLAPPLALLLMAFLSGCKRSPEPPRRGVQVTCTCTYLTDFDDTARIDVDVCIPENLDIKREAAHCALQSAHNHIDECSCQTPTGPCDPSAPQACVNR